MISRIVGLEFQVANRLGAKRADMNLEGFFLRRGAAVVDHLRGQEVELDVWMVDFWISSKVRVGFIIIQYYLLCKLS